VRRLVGGNRGAPESREVLRASAGAAGGQAASERNSKGRSAEVPRAQGAAGQVDHRCEVDVDARKAKRLPCCFAGVERITTAGEARCGLVRRQLIEGRCNPSLLVDEDEGAVRPRCLPVVLPHDYASHAPGSGKSRDHDERGLLARSERR
jgi:hypothetical protein